MCVIDYSAYMSVWKFLLYTSFCLLYSLWKVENMFLFHYIKMWSKKELNKQNQHERIASPLIREYKEITQGKHSSEQSWYSYLKWDNGFISWNAFCFKEGHSIMMKFQFIRKIWFLNNTYLNHRLKIYKVEIWENYKGNFKSTIEGDF